jgi:hypothetical protein
MARSYTGHFGSFNYYDMIHPLKFLPMFLKNGVYTTKTKAYGSYDIMLNTESN